MLVSGESPNFGEKDMKSVISSTDMQKSMDMKSHDSDICVNLIILK